MKGVGNLETPPDYYKQNGPMTSLGAHEDEFRALPKDIASLCEVVQSVLIHRDIAPFLYGLTLTEEQRDDGHIRPIAQMLTRIHELDSRPITTARDVGHRLPSVCRHFSLMLCSILRYQGIPARPRCGFGAYFNPGRFEDHWVCEYWNVAQSRWILVDAQMDAIQRKTFKLDFNPVDVPRDRFIIAGDAWQMCRSGLADSAAFGLTHVHLQGLWFVQGNVLRDVASLNRMEMLPWDVWGAMDINDAALTFAGDEKFNEMRAIYQSDDRLRVPPLVFNALRNAQESIATS